MTYQMGIELEIGAITLNDVRDAVRAAGGILHNTESGANRVYPYHGARRFGYNHGDSATTEKPVWKIEADSSIATPRKADCDRQRHQIR